MESISIGEIQLSKVPIPLINYVNLIIKKSFPYYDIVKFLLMEMEIHYQNAQKEGMSKIVYTINPRMFQEEIQKMIKSDKITTVNICRTILAFFHLAGLKEREDFFITTTSSGRKNYHVKVTPQTFNLLLKPLLV